MCVGSSDGAFAEAEELYARLLGAAKAGDGKVMGVLDLGEMNRKLIAAVSDALSDPAQEIQSTIGAGVETSRAVAADLAVLPGTMSEELVDVPRKLEMAKLESIPEKVRMLVASLQTAVEDPKILFPRTACGELPVDPAKIMSLTKKYALLEKLDGVGGAARTDAGAAEDTTGSRSLTKAPGSTGDVIKNVSKSVQGLSGPLILAVEKIQEIKQKLETTKKAILELNSVQEPLQGMQNKQKELREMLDRVTGLFKADAGSSQVGSRGLGDGSTNVMGIVSEGQAVVRSMQDSRGPLEESAGKIKAAGSLFTNLAKDIKDLFDLARAHFADMVALLKQFIAQLPRIIQELRQFFVPTGLRAFFIHPSNDFLSLLNSVEEVKNSLPDPDHVETTARGMLDGDGPGKGLHSLKAKLDSLLEVPERVASVIEDKDLGRTVIETVRAALKEYADELRDNVVKGTAGQFATAIGGEKFANALNEYLPFSDNNVDNEKQAAGDKSRNGWEESVANATGGLFKSLF